MTKITKLLGELDWLERTQAEIAEQIASTRNLIIDKMKKDGLTQVKTPEQTVSVAKRVSYSVNEFDWRAWATEQPDIEVDMFYTTTLDKKRVTDYAEQTLKTTGEVVPGIDAKETEYLSIRKADKK